MIQWYLAYICAHCGLAAKVPLLTAEILNSSKMVLVCNECGERTTVTSLHLVMNEYNCESLLYRSAVAFPRETQNNIGETE